MRFAPTRLTPMLVLAAALVTASAGPSALHAQTPPQPTAITQFQGLEDQWSVALVNKDQFALDNLLAPTFVDISGAAAVRTRNQLIADVLDGQPQALQSIEQKVVNVRTLGDTALVEGTYILHWRQVDGSIRDERGVFTHVYTRVHDRWTAINAQRTEVAEAPQEPATRRQRAAASPSSPKHSDLPFHIPLLSRSSNSSAPVPPTTSNPQ